MTNCKNFAYKRWFRSLLVSERTTHWGSTISIKSGLYLCKAEHLSYFITLTLTGCCGLVTRDGIIRLIKYDSYTDKEINGATYPSARGQSRLGPRTMAMLLGVILFTACCSDSRDKNWTRYLSRERRRKHSGLVEDRDTESHRRLRAWFESMVDLT